MGVGGPGDPLNGPVCAIDNGERWSPREEAAVAGTMSPQRRTGRRDRQNRRTLMVLPSPYDTGPAPERHRTETAVRFFSEFVLHNTTSIT